MSGFDHHAIDGLREREAQGLAALQTRAETVSAAVDDQPTPGLSILHVEPDAAASWEMTNLWLDQAQSAGFTAVLISPLFAHGVSRGSPLITDHSVIDARLALSAAPLAISAGLKDLAEACRRRGLLMMMDAGFDRFAPEHPLVQSHPDAFTLWGGREGEETGQGGEARPRLFEPTIAGLIGAWATEQMAAWVRAGIGGFRLRQIASAPPGFWRAVIHGVRRVGDGRNLVFVADAQGAPRSACLALAGCGFDYLTSSLGWWDRRARWLVEEYEDLRQVAPLIAAISIQAGTGQDRGDGAARLRGLLALAGALGPGRLVSMQGQSQPAAALAPTLRWMNRRAAGLSDLSGELRVLTGPGSPVTALLRCDAQDVRQASKALLVLVNPSETAPAMPDAVFLAGAGADFAPFQSLDGEIAAFSLLAPNEVRLLVGRRGRSITRSPPAVRKSARAAAARLPRLVIDHVTPRVDGGDYPVRRVVGERVTVEADVFADGHCTLAVELQWRSADSETFQSIPMTPIGNDRWRGVFPLARLGRYRFTIEAWANRFGGFRRDLTTKLEAGVVMEIDLLEGRTLIEAAARRAEGDLKAALDQFTARVDAESGQSREARADLLLAPDIQSLMHAADDRPHRHRLAAWQALDAERLQARFASWYELFPRSQTDDPARHGTFDDVIARLPALRAMGFDVLYFPPIHPIGETNRKGANNALIAGPGEPGSPYAIGSHAGGHDAIHPELGDFGDFRRLVAAAADHGLEIALDFAVQCAPDHPWIKQHPNWFDWRPDGSLKHAENPPKKYEDIVNVDFYAAGAVPDLWVALRAIILLWIGEGVRLFRVDNPHTKPLPFWAWLIDQIRTEHPDVVFLAEAFTRPKLMYQLAKLGFSQSYGYFTWRNSKSELTEYITELTTTEVREFYRPHLFVNTPDINPYFLQTGGRSAFLIRAALAATLSGLWGVYSGFEQLEAAALPGREEYQDSEKYQIRVRNGTVEGDISAEIAQLNRLRKGQPALQTHLGVRFYQAFNDNILYFGKALHFIDSAAPLHDLVLTAVSLDPHAPQSADFEIPLWEWGLPDDAALAVQDLINGTHFTWQGKRQSLHLTPDRPYAVWCVRPAMAET
jgi:starch synthase (maltosyl-transferring)